MAEKTNTIKSEKSGRNKVISIICILIPVLFLSLYLAVKLFIGTSYASKWLSEYLTDFLQQRVSVAGLSLSGTTLSARGIALENPAGFQPGTLLRSRSLAIAPNWSAILSGKKDLSLLQVEGLHLHLSKNSIGEWNFQQLVRSLTSKKKQPAAEVSIKHLVLRDLSLQINNFAWKNLSLTLQDFTTKGSSGSKLLFTGKDTRGNPLSLGGDVRLGKDPVAHLTFAAPDLALDTFRDVTKSGSKLDLEKGTAHVNLTAGYQSGELAASGIVGFEQLGVRLKDGRIPLTGSLDLSARYNIARDEARLERCALTINKVLRMKAAATMRKVKTEKEFQATLTVAELRGKDLLPFVPAKLLRDFYFDGIINGSDLRLKGTAEKGIAGGGGRVTLDKGELTQAGTPLLRNITADIKLAKAKRGWDSTGRLSLTGQKGNLRLDQLAARFAIHLSDNLRSLVVEVPRVQARLNGVPVRGELTYTPKARDPYRAALTTGKIPVASLTELLGRKDILFSSGTTSVALHATGSSPSSFSGEINTRLQKIDGTLAGKALKLRNSVIDGRFGRAGGAVSANGKAKVDGGMYAAKSFAGSFAFVLAGNNLSLNDGSVDFGHTHVSFNKISGRIPARQSSRSGTSYPLSLSFSGLGLKAGDTHVENSSGTINASYLAGPGGPRLDGRGTIALPAVAFRNQAIAMLQTQVTLSGKTVEFNIQGSTLGGTVAGLVRFEPFAATKGVSFTAALQNLQADKLSDTFPSEKPWKASTGTLAANISGTWSAQQGIICSVDATGHAINLIGKHRKVLIMGAGVHAKGDVTGPNISIKEAVLTQGENIALKLGGAVTNFNSPSRQGKLAIELATTSINSLLDTFANVLPKPLQQANGGGQLGMNGTLAIAGPKVLLNGNLHFTDALLELPDQKVNVTGLKGTLPFSLNLAGVAVSRPADDLIFSKENYAELLRSFRKGPKTGHLLTIAKIQFGALETGDIKIHALADNGRIDFTSIESSLYNGTGIAKGYLQYDNGLIYAGDILLNDMSLRLFCNSYPALKGYISGLLDGIISLYGGKGGLPEMIGFVDLWAHKGKNEKMLVSKEFLQKLAGKNLKGFFFRNDRPYNNGEISAYMESGYLTFEKMDISHTNFLGMKDLNVSVAAVQNRIGLDHLFHVIREAASRGKVMTGAPAREAPVQTDLDWLE
jgi:hypothetical protein